MRWLSTLFHQGGPTMFWVEYLAIVGLAFAAAHFFGKQAWTRWAQLAVIALVVASGLYGTIDGRSRTDQSVGDDVDLERDFCAHRDPDARPCELNGLEDLMREQGYAEAMRPIQFAGAVGGGLVLLLGIAELRRRARRPTASSSASRSASRSDPSS